MKMSSFFRSADWWDYKIVPLFFIGYFTIMLTEENLIQHLGWLLFLIFSISVGAIYVSIINDFTDLKFDIASGKPNRLEHFSLLKRKLILLTSILISLAFCYIFSDDILSFIFYTMAYVSFSLYSFPPFRLKNRGFLGVIADASGAHLFPSLFIVASMSHRLGMVTDVFCLILIGIWSFAYGLRGNIWHQFWDRENDLSINHKTFATSTNISVMKPVEIIITTIEITAIMLLLLSLGKTIPLISLMCYILILFGYIKIKYKIVLIISGNPPWHFLMSDFYEVLLPFSLIITCSIYYPWCISLLIFHLLFFPNKPKNLTKNILMMVNLKKHK